MTRQLSLAFNYDAVTVVEPLSRPFQGNALPVSTSFPSLSF